MDNNGNWKKEEEINWMEMEGETFQYDIRLAIENKILPWEKRNLYQSIGGLINKIKISEYIEEILVSNSSPSYKKEKDVKIIDNNKYVKRYIEKVYTPKVNVSYCLYNNKLDNDSIIGIFDSVGDLTKYLGASEDWYWSMFSNNIIKKEDIFFNIVTNGKDKLIEATHNRFGIKYDADKKNRYPRILRNLEMVEIREVTMKLQ